MSKINDNYSNEQLEQLRHEDKDYIMDDDRIEFYCEFLKEDDFETFQPVCYMDKSSIEYLQAEIERRKAWVRMFWIEKRFCQFLSVKWYNLHDKYLIAQSDLELMKAVLEKRQTGKYEMKPPKDL